MTEPAAAQTAEVASQPAEPQAVVEQPAQQVQAEEQPKKPKTREEKRRELIERLQKANQVKAEKRAERLGETPQQAQAATATPAADKPAEAKPDGKEEPPKPKQEDARADELEQRVVKLARQLRDAKADGLETRQAAESYVKVASAKDLHPESPLAKRLAAAKEDTNAKLELIRDLFGQDYGQLTEEIIKNGDKVKSFQELAKLPPEVREELEASRKLREKLAKDEADAKAKAAAEEQQKQTQQRVVNYTKTIGDFIAANADEFPLSAALDWSAGAVASACIEQKASRGEPVLRQHEQDLEQSLSGALSKEAVVKHLLSKQPELRAVFEKVLGLAKQPNPQPQPEKPAVAPSLKSDAQRSTDGPSTLTNRSTASDTAAPNRLLSRQEKRERLIQRVRAGGGPPSF